MRMPTFHRPRYADVAATLALVIATSGTAYAATTVGTADIKDGAVTTPKLHVEAVTPSKIQPGAVTHAKLGANSVDGSNVAAKSLSLHDLVGGDIKGAIAFTLPANHCGDLALGVSGAEVGQVVLFSFVGTTAVPTSLTFGGSKVTSAGHVTVKACNVSSSTISVSDLGIHVVTFG